MPERSELVAEAVQIVEDYRSLAQLVPSPEDLPAAGFAIGRALACLEVRSSHESLTQASADLAAARVTLARIRRTFDR